MGIPIVLASVSPRRQELLRNAGIIFKSCTPEIVEAFIEGESPRDCAERLAVEKAKSVAAKFPHESILAADTVVVINNEILGKPRHEADARRMLGLLSGRSHEVITGVCLMWRTENSELVSEDVRSERTIVSMSELSDNEIRSYAATVEPMDKAGAYAIQGVASRWIYRIEGDYFNVVGLPISLLYRMLREHSIL